MRLYPRDPKGKALPEYGIDSNRIGVKRFPLDTAISMEEHNLGGSALWAYRASSLSAYLDIHINDQRTNAIRFQQGLFIRGVPFSRLFVTITAQAGEWIEFVYVTEPMTTNVQIENPLISANSVTLTKATVFETQDDKLINSGASTTILSSAPARRTAIIGNLSTNANIMRIGDVNVGVTRGQELLPGESITINSTKALYGFNTNSGAGGNEKVSRMWTED